MFFNLPVSIASILYIIAGYRLLFGEFLPMHFQNCSTSCGEMNLV